MKGSTHAAIGTACGIGVALWTEAAPVQTIVLACTGMIGALVPDLDVNGKLANKITIQKKWLILFFSAAGLLLSLYSYFLLESIRQMAGFLISFSLLLLPRLFIKQRTMLFVTGTAVVYAGWSLQVTWLLYVGLFILFASLVSHRTWTHSLIGILIFYFVAAEIEKAYAGAGLYEVLMISYFSHLAADMKIFPSNKKGVKYFYPVWKKEF